MYWFDFRQKQDVINNVNDRLEETTTVY